MTYFHFDTREHTPITFESIYNHFYSSVRFLNFLQNAGHFVNDSIFLKVVTRKCWVPHLIYTAIGQNRIINLAADGLALVWQPTICNQLYNFITYQKCPSVPITFSVYQIMWFWLLLQYDIWYIVLWEYCFVSLSLLMQKDRNIIHDVGCTWCGTILTKFDQYITRTYYIVVYRSYPYAKWLLHLDWGDHSVSEVTLKNIDQYVQITWMPYELNATVTTKQSTETVCIFHDIYFI